MSDKEELALYRKAYGIAIDALTDIKESLMLAKMEAEAAAPGMLNELDEISAIAERGAPVDLRNPHGAATARAILAGIPYEEPEVANLPPA